MGGQAQEGVSQNWLTPEALIDFIEELRHIGFNIGLAEYIAAQDLLLMLTARGENLQDEKRAASLLGPLLCSSPAEQETFPEHFDRWARRQQASLRSEQIVHEETMTEALEKTARRGLRWEWILFVLGVVLLSAAAWYFARSFIQVEIPSPSGGPPVDVLPDSWPLIQMVLAAGLLLILAYVAWFFWWRRLANQFLQRRQAEGSYDIKNIALSASDDALYPSLTFLSLARLFRQRVQVVSGNLNVVRTVEQSVEQGGWLNPVYDRLLVPPEYLVLVDRRSRFDHLAQFMEGMVKRLETHGVFVTAYVFDGDPRLCFPLGRKEAPQSLSELAARYENMRLIIFTESQNLLNPVNGRLPFWSRLFNRWTYRSVFTPEPSENWGVTEQELQRQFIVLPGSMDGLATFMRMIQGQEKVVPIYGMGESPIPLILQERPQRWIEHDAPSRSQVESLLEELKLYLGEEGYAWFEACAVYPELQWQITLTLGQLLKDSSGNPILNSNRLVDLARLPWFRYGLMPDWLRTRLILDLAPAQEEEIRAILEALLVTAVQGHGESLDLEVAYERREWTSRLARPLLRILRRENSQEGPLQDHVFIDFMFQRMNLAVRIPNTLRQQLFTRAGVNPGWKVLLQWMGANLAIVLIFTLIDLWLSTLFFSSSLLLYIILNGLFGLSLGLVQWWVMGRILRVGLFSWVGGSFLAYLVVGLLYYSPDYAPDRLEIFQLLSLTLVGIVQTYLFSRARVTKSRMWLFVNLIIGMINTSWLYLVSTDSDFQVIWVNILCATVYAFGTGWLLLSFLRNKPVAAIIMLRLTWIFYSSIGSSMGLVIGVLLYNAIGTSYDDFLVYSLVSIVWMAPFALGQSLALKTQNFKYVWLWFWLTCIPFSIAFGSFLLNQPGGDELATYTLFGVGTGIAVGLTQSFVWRRSGLRPFQLLLWFLSTSIGVSLMFIGLGFVLTTNPETLDQLELLSTLPVLLYSIATVFPLPSLLREALLHQKASIDDTNGKRGGSGFSPLSIFAKIRSQESSTRAPL